MVIQNDALMMGWEALQWDINRREKDKKRGKKSH